MAKAEWLLRVIGGMSAALNSATMAPGLFVDDGGRVEFGRLLALITLTGAIWTFLGWLFLPKLKERARAMRMADPEQYGLDVVTVLQHATVQPAFKQMVDALYAGRIERVDAGVDVARHTADRVEQLMTDHVPRLEETLSKLNGTLEKVQEAFGTSQVIVARVEERTKLIAERQEAHYAGVERRHQARRQSDPDPE